MVNRIGLSAFAVVLFALGVCFLFYTAKIQAMALKAVNLGLGSNLVLVGSSMRFAKKFVESRQYRLCIRIIGALSVFCAIFLALALIEQLRDSW